MGHRSRPPRLVASVVVTAWLLASTTGCHQQAPKAERSSGSPTLSQATTPSSGDIHGPQIGECRRLTWHQAAAATASAKPVPCRTAHTAETYAVGQLPVVQQGHRLSVDSPIVTAQVAQICPRRLSRIFDVSSRDLRLLTVKPVWFVPSPREAEAGATWFRCDAITIAGHQKLDRSRGPLKQRLADPESREAVALCGTTTPGTTGFVRVPCSQPHRWRAIDTVDLDGSYPKGPGVLGTACRSAAKAAADDPLDFRWSQELPTRAQWDAGQRYGVCWAPG